MPSLVLGSARAQFTITLSVAASEPVSVEWFTKDGTALAGRDYEANSGTVVFAPGEVTKTVEVFVHGRTVETEDRVFYVRMLPPVNAILADEVGACVIHVDTTGSQPVMTVVIPKGEKGERGYSAYEIALQNGFVGTEAEWLESLKPDPAEVAEEVAPLINASTMPLTAEGTEDTAHPDTSTVAGFAARIAYLARSKKAFSTPLSAGDNVIPMGTLIGDAVDPRRSGFTVNVKRAGKLYEIEWEYLADSNELKIIGATAGDVATVSNFTGGPGEAARTLVKATGQAVYRKLGDWLYMLAAIMDTTDPAKGASLVGYIGNFLGAVSRNLYSKASEIVSGRDFGCVGDYYTDDTDAMEKADQYSFATGHTIDLGDGQYSITRSFVRKGRYKGNGAPTLGTFPLTADDKIYMRPGYKHLMPGCSIWLKGTFTGVQVTARADRFASFTYGMMTDPAAITPHISGIALIVDMDVFDAAGNLTSVAQDNRSVVDVAYYHTTGWTNHSDFVVFGYPKKAGTLIYGADIDYNTFDADCSTSGDIGLAICGNGVTGLSGTRYDGEIYANDHHSRSNVDNQWGTTALYIDGAIPSASAPQNSIGGHYFRGSIRTYCDNPFILDNCNTVVFDGCVFEWPNRVGSVGATKALPVGSANTYGVVLKDCRHLSPIGPDGIYQFANSIGGCFIHSDPRHGNLGLAYNGKGAFLRANGGNPALQLTRDINGATKGWTHLMNLSSSDRFESRYENATLMTLSTTGSLNANRLVAALTGNTSATDPALRLSASDTTTGFYRPSANNVALSINGVKAWDWQTDGFLRPGADNTFQIGSGSFRVKEYFGANNIINTSDGELKTVRGDLSDQELEAWGHVRQRVFQWNDSLAEKGDEARLNVGLIAQEVRDAFSSAGLDAARYALWCEDDVTTPVTKTRKVKKQKVELIDEQVERIRIVDDVPVRVLITRQVEKPMVTMCQITDEDGNPLDAPDGSPAVYPVPVTEEVDEEYIEHVPAGTRLGLRYEQCLVMEAAYMRTRVEKLERALAELKGAN